MFRVSGFGFRVEGLAASGAERSGEGDRDGNALLQILNLNARVLVCESVRVCKNRGSRC